MDIKSKKFNAEKCISLFIIVFSICSLFGINIMLKSSVDLISGPKLTANKYVEIER